MKLLLDENISYRVVKAIVDSFPGSIHVGTIADLKEDSKIFEYARLNGLTIVTFDEDFYELQLIRGHPPKIIWLRFGNSSNQKLTSKLMENKEAIASFLLNPDTGILEIY